MEKLEIIDFGFQYKDVGVTGQFEGWASTHSVDLGNDKVLPGAFKTTLRKHGGKIPVLFNHDRNQILGRGMEAYEDERGLYVKAQINMDTQLGREKHSLMMQGALSGLSIGFKMDKDGWVPDGRTRLLKSIELMEYSAVVFPMQLEAQVLRVKSIEDMTPRELEEILRESGHFSKNDVLCLMAKGGLQLLKERRRESGPNSEVTEEAEALFFDLKSHMSDLTTRAMLAQLSQSLT